MPGKLTYFKVGGRAESIRALLCHAGIEFEDNIVESNQPLKESGYSPMGGLPVWEEDGFVMCQGNAIMRNIGMRHGYYSEDAEICFNIDSLQDFAEDVLMMFGGYMFAMNRGNMEGIEEKREKHLAYWDKHIKLIGDRLEASGKPFAGGTDRPSIADFKVFAQPSRFFKDTNSGSVVEEEMHEQVMAKINARPVYKAWIDRMKQENTAWYQKREPTAF